MSNRKDAGRISSTKKLSSNSSKSNTNIRDGSTERKKSKNLEIPNKTKTKHSSLTNVKPKTTENVIKPEKHTSKPTVTSSTSSKTSVDTKSSNIRKISKPDVPVTPTNSRISKTQFFPSKNMYSSALKTKDSSTPKGTDENSSKMKRSDSNVKGKMDIKKKTSSQKTSNLEQTDVKSGEKRDGTQLSGRNKLTEKVTPRKSPSISRSMASIDFKVKPEVGPTSLESNRSVFTSPDSSTFSERPRTATLGKGSIVNTNIVGPDAPKYTKPLKDLVHSKLPKPKSETSEDFNYEEDFESYESDFEQYSSSSSSNLNDITGEETSSVTTNSDTEAAPPNEQISAQKRIISTGGEEERQLDSGHFEMADYKHRQMLDNIKESVEKENSNLVLLNNPASLSDEGFEDQKSLQFINFLDAKRKYEHRKSLEIKHRRGKEILSMIRLDTYSFTLFDLAPVPYDIFIKKYGTSNTLQTTSQTGEDDVHEEIQTDDIAVQTKWTQVPIKLGNGDQEEPNFWQLYKQDYLGVGTDYVVDEKTRKPLFNEYSLNTFLIAAGKLVTKIQEESGHEKSNDLKKNNKSIPFSDGHIMFKTTGNVLDGTTVKCVSFSCDMSARIMTVHLRNRDVLSGGSLIAIWKRSNSEEPEAVLTSYGSISCCSFGNEKLELIFAGLEDGTLSVWYMRSSSTHLVNNNIPLYSTDIGFGHQIKVVALHSIGNSSEDYFVESSHTNEICSLDESGEIILWTVIVKSMGINNEFVTDEVVLVINATVSLRTVHPNLIDLQCTDFVLSDINTNFAFISTNYGFIIHHLVKGGRSNVKKFLPDTSSRATCMDTCPFIPDFFLAGYENGDINLYSRMIEKPLMVLSDKESKIDGCNVQLIQWSKNKPFVIYTMDKRNVIHIWDLSESDMFPIYSIPIGKEITCMKLSPSEKYAERNKSYMMIGTKDGSLLLHQLSEEHGQQPKQIFDEHIRTFLNYVNRL
ncbi:hypothetical protein JTB14_000381 [Gonioctena quinquepunctata]|nr:hypothetical protein JTB14_000381 [Gonioctena quinquepunctata]